MNQTERRKYLIGELLKEDPRYAEIEMPSDEDEQRRLLRGLMNVRAPRPISPEFLLVQDEYLQRETAQRGITDVNEIACTEEGLGIWQGDITTLRCDAIVNAANSGMTGCYIPNHACIDNCIHTYSGIELRLACADIMDKQGYEEPTGQAKITQAYNLPSRYVLHTVGPVVEGPLTQEHRDLLAASYRSCLELASQNDLETVVFCCISTGVFHFPNEEAASIAVETVRDFMKGDTSITKVIFNVFKDGDRDIYERLLRADQTA